MKEYLICGAFWIVFTLFLYALGNAVIEKQKSQSYKLIAGYLVYSFFVAIGGITIQIINVGWNVFAAYMCLLWVGLIGFICVRRKRNGRFFSGTIQQIVREQWFLIIVCLIFIFMLFVYFRPFWYGNHLDDGYYVTKVATMPFENEPFRTNYSVGTENTYIDSYVFNTWELEASFYVRYLGVETTLFLRLFQSAFHYFILLNCALAFGMEIIPTEIKKQSKNQIQYVLGITLLFGIYYVFLEDTKLLHIKDLFHFNSAMFYGSSLMKVIAIMLMMLFYLNDKRMNLKMIVGVGAISVVLISKSSVSLPIIVLIIISSTCAWLFEENTKWKKIAAISLGGICCVLGAVLPNSTEMQSFLYKYVRLSVQSPVFLICVLIFGTSFLLKSRVVYRLNTILGICAVLILVPQINDLFEKVSIYNFVAARAWSTFVYTFIIVNGFYLYSLLNAYFPWKACIRGIYIGIAVFFTGVMVYGFSMDGGELFSEGTLPAKTTLKDSFKVIYNNRFFTPNSTIELGNALQAIGEESETPLRVVSPENVGIDGTVHTLATQLRAYAPNIISVSALNRYPVDDNSFLQGYNQQKYDEFVNNPNKNTTEKFAEEVDKYNINCIVVIDEKCDSYLESMGFECKAVIQNGVYYVYCKK